MATKVSALTKATTLDNDDLIYIAKSNSVSITKQNFENSLSLNTNTNSRIVRGGVVWVSGLIYETVDLIYEINGAQYDITNGTQVTLSTADATNPRIDVIYGDDLGAISIEAGTPLATPVKPTIQEGYQIELTFATVAATATEPTGVAIDTLYLEDVGQPTEWDATDNTGGVRIDTADTTTPITGTKSIRTIATLTDLDSFTLTNATPINTAELNYLRLSIKLLNTMQKKEFITVNLKSATTVVGSFIIDQNAIDRTDLTTQTLTIFNADFSAFSGASFDNIEFPCRSLGTIQYQIDDITIFTSDVITSPTNITGSDVSLDTTNFDTNLDGTITDVQKLADAVDDLNRTKYVINEITANYILLSTDKDTLLRVKDYANITIPTGLGLGFRIVIKRTTTEFVGVVASENVTLELASGYLENIFAQNDAIELVLEEIDGATEFWGIYGALDLESNYTFLDNLKQIINITDDLSINQMAFPQVYLTADYPLFTGITKKYFTIYSTDHETDAVAEIWWGQMDDPEFNGFVEGLEIITPNDGYQQESPFLIKIPTAKSGLTTDTYFLYFHTSQNDPDNAASSQESHLITCNGGVTPDVATWTERDDTNGDNVFHLEIGENHTGYGRVWEKSDGSFVAYHQTYADAGGDSTLNKNHNSTSTNGIDWVRGTETDASNSFVDDAGSGRLWYRIDLQFLFEVGGVVYGIVYTADNPLSGDLRYRSLCTLNSSTYLPDTYIKDIYTENNNDFFSYVVRLENEIVYLYIRDRDGGATFTGDWYLHKLPYSDLGI